MRVLMAMLALHHNQAGGISQLSAFPLSVVIPFGTRLVRTGIANDMENRLIIHLFLCSHTVVLALTTFTHVVLAIVRFPYDLICRAFSGNISECFAVANHGRALLRRLEYAAGHSFVISLRLN
jgi:hypothetical protein